MASKEQIEKFWQSWYQWRNSLPDDQRWMADAMAYSATQAEEVQGYATANWSYDKAYAFYSEQNAGEWQKYSDNAKYVGYSYKY